MTISGSWPWKSQDLLVSYILPRFSQKCVTYIWLWKKCQFILRPQQFPSWFSRHVKFHNHLKILYSVNSKAWNWNAKIQSRGQLPHHWSLCSGIKLCDLAAIKALETFWLFHSGEHHWSFSGFWILGFSRTFTEHTEFSYETMDEIPALSKCWVQTCQKKKWLLPSIMLHFSALCCHFRIPCRISHSFFNWYGQILLSQYSILTISYFICILNINVPPKKKKNQSKSK